jgi:ubiquinone/menaquinone biosynthesis C-methylase UbiE
MNFSKHSGMYEGPIARIGRNSSASSQSFVHGRLSCPNELIEKVISVTGLTGQGSLLDLGCGDGRLGIAFAPYAKRVVGVDCDPGMIQAASACARDKGVEVTFRFGEGLPLDDLPGNFHLVTVGSSFRGMDREWTLEALDRIVYPFGALALFRDSHPEIPQNLWYKRLQSLLRSLAETEHSISSGEFPGAPRIPDEFFLLKSKFNRLERVSVIQGIETPIERVLHRAWSMAIPRSEQLESEMKTILENLRALLNQHASNGLITEVIESEALVAFRSDPSRP